MSAEGLTVAVTGPTGDIGRALIPQLEQAPEVARILGMARRPFDPAEHGWTKTEYRQGDVLDRDAVDAFVAGADVVVHLAFIIFGSREETRSINLRGSRAVFEATVAAGARRLVYTSSVAAYGFEPGRPHTLTEDMPPAVTNGFYYSAQKAELEGLLQEIVGPSETDAYVFRPCIVAGPEARMMIDVIPYVSIAEKLPGVVQRLFDSVPILKPVIPDPGVPFQLVHHDDVASALAAAVVGRGSPGIYNLAADDTLTMREVAAELGWRRIPVPDVAVAAAAQVVSHVPQLPNGMAWVHALRVPSVMRTERAREELAWEPRFDARETLRQTVRCARANGVIA